jgi:hypothetical protein
MNFKVEIKEGNKLTTYTVDFSPTEKKIKEATGRIGAVMRELFPKVTKETKETNKE